MDTTNTATQVDDEASRAGSALVAFRWSEKKKVERTCEHCGISFLGWPEQRYCTYRHNRAAAAKRWRENHPGPNATERSITGIQVEQHDDLATIWVNNSKDSVKDSIPLVGDDKTDSID